MRFLRSNKKILRYLLILSISTALALTIVSLALGRPHRSGKLPDKGKNFGCGTCHTNPRGSGPRNPFGQDYERIGMNAGDKYTPELGKLDSDKDGSTNDQEFASNTNPGDSKSKPGSRSASNNATSAEAELTKAINKGKVLFNNTKLGKSGNSCNSCHPGGKTSGRQAMGMNIPSLEGAAATFPKYRASAKRVITLQQMNNMCVEMIMQGKPLPLDSDDSIALAAYVTSLSNGTKIQVGNK